MKILILGGDGFLGWPTAMHFANRNHEVAVVDNYLRRFMAMQTRSEALIPTPNLPERAEVFEKKTGSKIKVHIGDCTDGDFLDSIVESFKPDTIIHYAEQPSAPYSMIGKREAGLTLLNNITSTFNVIWSVIAHAPKCHIIKLGTMGEYGTPNIDIEEGFIDIEHNGRKDRLIYPRASGSLYHTSKINDTDLLWFYVRLYGLRVTDLMQGPVYGLYTPECDLDERLMPNFHYDDIFGTVVNRFLVQAVHGSPLTVYGKGGQTRGYLNLLDTLQCIGLAAKNPPEPGNMTIMNQFTEQFSILELADKIKQAGVLTGIKVEISHVDNPRKELEEHYYNAAHSKLQELGLVPHYMTPEVLADMLRIVRKYSANIDPKKFMPRVKWNKKVVDDAEGWC